MLWSFVVCSWWLDSPKRLMKLCIFSFYVKWFFIAFVYYQAFCRFVSWIVIKLSPLFTSLTEPSLLCGEGSMVFSPGSYLVHEFKRMSECISYGSRLQFVPFKESWGVVLWTGRTERWQVLPWAFMDIFILNKEKYVLVISLNAPYQWCRNNMFFRLWFDQTGNILPIAWQIIYFSLLPSSPYSVLSVCHFSLFEPCHYVCF